MKDRALAAISKDKLIRQQNFFVLEGQNYLVG